MKILVTAAQTPGARSACLALERDPRVTKVVGVDSTTGFPHGNEPGYVRALARASEEFDAVLVCSDPELAAVAGEPLPDVLERTLVVSPARSIQLALDKPALFAALSAAGVPVPTCIVGGWARKRHYAAEGRRESIDTFVCEYLPGPEFSVDAVAWRGELRAAVVRERLNVVRTACVRGRVVQSPEIEGLAANVCSALHLHGGLNIQFMLRATAEPVLTDVNARFGGGVSISEAAGANLLALLVDLLRGETPRLRGPVQCGVFAAPHNDAARAT